MKRKGRDSGSRSGVREHGLRQAVPCPVCEGPTENARLYEVRGSASDVIAVLLGIPCHICRIEEHPRVFSSNDFRAKLTDAVFGGPFPATRPRRFGKIACGACGKRLRDPRPANGDIEGRIVIDGADMTVTLTAPLVECARCGSVQLHATPEVCGRVQEALDAAFKRGRLRQ